MLISLSAPSKPSAKPIAKSPKAADVKKAAMMKLQGILDEIEPSLEALGFKLSSDKPSTRTNETGWPFSLYVSVFSKKGDEFVLSINTRGNEVLIDFGESGEDPDVEAPDVKAFATKLKKFVANLPTYKVTRLRDGIYWTEDTANVIAVTASHEDTARRVLMGSKVKKFVGTSTEVFLLQPYQSDFAYIFNRKPKLISDISVSDQGINKNIFKVDKGVIVVGMEDD